MIFTCRPSFRRWPWLPGRSLTVLDGAIVGVADAGIGPALLLTGLVAVLMICRRLQGEDRELLLAGVIGIGLLVALTGWLGVAGRAGSWVFQAQGLWRASSTLTYPNATAAVLVSISLVVLGRLVTTPGSVPLAVAAAGLLTGVAATMSRAGALALVVGLVVLAGLLGQARPHAPRSVRWPVPWWRCWVCCRLCRRPVDRDRCWRWLALPPGWPLPGWWRGGGGGRCSRCWVASLSSASPGCLPMAGG